MRELVLIVCLAGEPATCHPERIAMASQDLTTCVTAMTVVAEWAEDHPGWTVDRWSCGGRPTLGSGEATR